MATTANTQWRKKAACLTVDPEKFFSRDSGDRVSARRTAHETTAKEICRRCPVSGNCLDTALRRNEIGVWGGTTAEERVKIRRSGYRASCARCRGNRIAKDSETQICLHCGLSWLL